MTEGNPNGFEKATDEWKCRNISLIRAVFSREAGCAEPGKTADWHGYGMLEWRSVGNVEGFRIPDGFTKEPSCG